MTWTRPDGRRCRLPDGSERYLADEALLLGGEGIGGLTVGVLTGVGGARGIRFGSGLAVAAIAADLGGCIEKDFDFGVGKDGRANVAALHDDSTGFAESALLLDHPGAEMGVDGDL